ncbi:solute carrier family 22 member 6-B-like isoform X2 [Rissa tridactyla]|uniref:solute carrier family 22 member 6-B-like isoform X2 n=1 Tax=Rissa tridactyla TaxID=75485 RepID=UPI0023BAB5C5|nr:solute carrier family 22 member 6-B-like isoform X2 [Rissa tridactyla]
MTFVELLARLGGMGRFQVTYVAALAIPLLMLASHNLLQNFTAGVPEHHCRPRPVANDSTGDVPLLISIPSDGHHRPQRCRRYVELQWHLLEVNGTVNSTANGAATEPCHDGWTYQDGIFAHTIVTEWDLVCESKKLRQVAQSIYMAGILLGSSLFGILSDKHGVDPDGSARRGGHHQWLLLHLRAVRAGGRGLRPPSLALAPARRLPPLLPLLPLLLAVRGVSPVAGDFGETRPGPEGAPQSRPHQREEGGGRQAQRGGAAGAGAPGATTARGDPGLPDPHPRDENRLLWRLLCLVLHQLRLLWAGHGSAGLRGGHLPEPAGLRGCGHPGQAGLGAGHQLRGAAGGPGRLLGARRHLHPRQHRCANGAADAAHGLRGDWKGFIGRLLQLRLHLHRRALPHCHQTGMGLGGTMARVGSMVAPLVRMTADVTPVLPLIIYGAAPIISAIATCFLPETRNVPLPETVKDVERRAGHLKDEEVTVPLSTTKTKEGV